LACLERYSRSATEFTVFNESPEQRFAFSRGPIALGSFTGVAAVSEFQSGIVKQHLNQQIRSDEARRANAIAPLAKIIESGNFAGNR